MTNEDVPELQSIWDDARRFIERGDYDKAVEIYQYILIRYSDYLITVEHANAYLGDILLTLRQLDTAEEHIKKAINFSPGIRPVYPVLATQVSSDTILFRSSARLHTF